MGRRAWASFAVLTLLAGCTNGVGTPAATPSAAGGAPADLTTPSESGGGGVELDVVAARAAHTASALADGRVLIAGGCVVDGCAEATSSTYLVNRDGATASDGPRMSVPRVSHTATVVGDLVVLAGGFAGERKPVATSVEIYEPTSDSIVELAELTQGRGGHAAAPLHDGRVLVVGGWVGPSTYTGSAEMIDPAVAGISSLPDLPVAADALDAVTLADGQVLVTGGQVRSGVGTTAAHLFNPDTGDWTPTGPMGQSRFKHFTVLLNDGRVLVMGGTVDDRTLLSSTEVFDPVRMTFGPGPDMAEPRYKMPGGAVVVGERVVIGGGGRTVEVLDLATGTSKVIEQFDRRGSFATISPVGSESLLLLGGYDDAINLRRAAAVIPTDEL